MSIRLSGRWVPRSCCSPHTTVCAATLIAVRPVSHTVVLRRDVSFVANAHDGLGHTHAASASPSPSPGKRFSVVRPDLVDDWIPEMNDVDVQSVLCSNSVRAWWRCPLCHASYQATIKERLAKEAACCPDCRGRGVPEARISPESARDTAECPSPSSSLSREGATTSIAAPLSETHPHLVAMWDAEANGTLHPHHVTANSTVSVWWRRSVPHLAHGVARFRRPVFAMARDDVSPHEKRIAQVLFEEQVLQSIHDVAHIESAEPSTMLPAASSQLFAPHSASRNVSPRTVQRPAESAVSPLTAGPALALWKRQARTARSLRTRGQDEPQESARAEGDGSARYRQEEASASETVPTSPCGRSLFYNSDSMLDRDAWQRGKHLRETVLDAYVRFVQQRRRAAGLSDDTASIPSMLGVAMRRGENGEHDDAPEDSGWLHFFTLTDAQASAETRLSEDAVLRLGASCGAMTPRTASQDAQVRTLVPSSWRTQTSPSSGRTLQSAQPLPALSAQGHDNVLKNYPQLSHQRARSQNTTPNESTSIPASPRARHRDRIDGVPRAGLAMVSQQLADAALHEAFHEAQAEGSSSSASLSSPLLDVALAAEDAVARERARQYRRPQSVPLRWSPEALLGAPHSAARGGEVDSAYGEHRAVTATAAAGYPSPPVLPRKVRRVRLQPPLELRRHDDPHTAFKADVDTNGEAMRPRVVLEMVRETAMRRRPEDAPSTATRQMAAEVTASSSTPTLSGAKMPRKVARPARKTTAK